jgi:methylmalonyl-CoA/ethylmalonyl-CoA epimerase
MVVDHIAVVVRSIEQAMPLWIEAFGYAPMTNPVVNSRQRVRVQFLSKDGSITIKLVEPVDAASPVHAVAARGGGLHHLCFRCESVPREVERLERAGMRVLSGPEPGEGFDDELIAFVYAGQGLNVELIDTDKKARLLPRKDSD